MKVEYRNKNLEIEYDTFYPALHEQLLFSLLEGNINNNCISYRSRYVCSPLISKLHIVSSVKPN